VKTAKAVVTGKSGEKPLDPIRRKMDEIVRRLEQRTLDPIWTERKLQEIVEGPKWKVWDSVIMGSGKYRAIDGFIRAFDRDKGWSINHPVEECLREMFRTVRFPELAQKRIADLVIVTAKDLDVGPAGSEGYDRYCFRLGEAYARARALGLSPCPLEAGLRALLTIEDEDDEGYLVASDPLMDRANEPYIVCSNEMNGRFLGVAKAFPRSTEMLETKMIFCKQVRNYPGQAMAAFKKHLEALDTKS
jgi:hypothetical protein